MLRALTWLGRAIAVIVLALGLGALSWWIFGCSDSSAADVRPHGATFWIERQYCPDLTGDGEHPCVWSVEIEAADHRMIPCFRWEIREDSGLACDFDGGA